VLLLFRRTQVHFTVTSTHAACSQFFFSSDWLLYLWWKISPLYFGAWQYPHQRQGHRRSHKISSWMLLVIISFIIVAALKEIFPKQLKCFPAMITLQAQTGEANTKLAISSKARFYGWAKSRARPEPKAKANKKRQEPRPRAEAWPTFLSGTQICVHLF
jgi:hypothetical protein